MGQDGTLRLVYCCINFSVSLLLCSTYFQTLLFHCLSPALFCQSVLQQPMNTLTYWRVPVLACSKRGSGNKCNAPWVSPATSYHSALNAVKMEQYGLIIHLEAATDAQRNVFKKLQLWKEASPSGPLRGALFSISIEKSAFVCVLICVHLFHTDLVLWSPFCSVKEEAVSF